jgi:hypothetical protein
LSWSVWRFESQSGQRASRTRTRVASRMVYRLAI